MLPLIAQSDEGLHVARAAIRWSLDLEIAANTAYGLKVNCPLPIFTEQLEMPIEEYFKEFELWFA